MLVIPASVKVFLAVEPCDMRKSFDSLQAIVRSRLREDPGSGALFLFTNKRRSRLKVLVWDGTGMWVMAKRLEKGTFSWPRPEETEGAKLALSRRALTLLLQGVELKEAQQRPWYES